MIGYLLGTHLKVNNFGNWQLKAIKTNKSENNCLRRLRKSPEIKWILKGSDCCTALLVADMINLYGSFKINAIKHSPVA